MKQWACILFLAVLPLMRLQAQTDDDSHWVEASTLVASADTVTSVVHENNADQWRPDPLRAVWMGTIIPGYGQIYNRAYWKLPIVYGAFMGCAYAITWNNTMYNDYKQAYRDILTDTDGTKTSYLDILPDGYTIEMMGGKTNYTNVLKNRQNTYRRYRDLSIVATVLVYALSLVDAYVDAQLFDFDISPDLSMTIEPQLYYDFHNNRSTELHVAINF
ncbi:MAG: DUF5683 domain-containing protein [Paludibacter sp.]|nr:DUF5683 domain-containing protein [Bacteroidales bacterium]MCM1069223.1 DUF5683 domain-containing protein [Prevotella sp.]MCM1354357.1 DUF5683 domain-containing protein [Bacteroides sp.]MCM1443183.1 DUF5683 domain-containing protein [Muribaculum sp.]MCM1481778.1 DUF5683 domain-containing protein [Paludibacter sp.]